MKIFVCVKQVPDTEAKIKLSADSHAVDFAGIKWAPNPYDEHAIEEALKLKEAGKATNVTAISLGPKARIVDVLRTALAMGADDAIAVDAPDDLDPISTAKALAMAIKAEGGDFGLVLTGKLAIDDNAASVSQMMAEYLAVPHATVVSKLEVQGTTAALVEREVEGGTREVIQVRLPAVIAANKGLNLPRYASLPGIMKAKKKVIKETAIAAVGCSPEDRRTRYKNYQMPASKPPVKILAGDAAQQARELVGLLRNEAKVI